VPFKILFADDSMTAQNMGTKILSEAGYEVVAVSNGAAAIKKIAEQKPDIIILDVYMPGYSGLEVCEKLRSSIETLHTPVLLTVGKMEHYRSEDANRVKADGLIVKPFEASDLLAIVKKLEERISPRPQLPLADQTLYLERPTHLIDDFQQGDFSSHAAQGTEFHPATTRSSIEVPDYMTSSAAFSDFMTAEDSSSESATPPPLSEPVVPPPEPAPSLWGWEAGREAAAEMAAYGTPPPPVPEKMKKEKE